MTDIIYIDELKIDLKRFAENRGWTKFHSPKNIAMAIAGEVGELLEILQWMTEQESRMVKEDADLKQQISYELADILLYAVQMADVLDINLNKALYDKIQINDIKYPRNKMKDSV
jgi:dCTP diphosphatase